MTKLSQPKPNRAFSAYEWMIAFRYMLPNKKQLFTSIISIISLVGIFLGVFVLIVVMAVMNGFRADLVDRLVGINGHIIISAVDGTLDDFETLIPRLEKVDGVKYAIPMVQGEAFIQGDMSSNGTGGYIRGAREEDLDKISVIKDNLKSGTLNGFDQVDGIAIGIGMAEKFGVVVGDSLRIISPDGDVTPFGTNPRVKNYEIVAIFDAGTSLYNNNLIYMPFNEAELFFNIEQVNNIEVFLNDPDATAQMLPAIEKTAGRSLNSVDWRFLNRDLFSALQIERIVMFIILSLIILVASLNIISGLIMLVKDKGHDIAILRTMGATRGAILRIFVLTGFIIGIIGTFFGTILALITCWNMEAVKEFISWLVGVDVFNPQVYPLAKLPVHIDMVETISVIVMALVLSFLASLLPAWRAARLDPVQALRNE